MAPKQRELQPGDKAPKFKLPMDGGEKIALSDLKGELVVLYFYPRDDTSGCTKEAIAFTDENGGAKLVHGSGGISQPRAE